MKKLLTLSAMACSVMAPSAMAAEEVNVYSYRQPFLIEPMFKEFTQQTGIKVNVKFAKEGIAEKLVQEGEYSPADVILTSEFSRLFELSEKGLVQAVDNKTIETNIPAQYRDSADEWFALTIRTRSVYSSRDRVGKLGDDFNYADLA
ncbi:MAG: extracellular solute-binding protein, partial [Vibrio sp.]|nr:extracellular solute-binding protein [Vibrio sp.]